MDTDNFTFYHKFSNFSFCQNIYKHISTKKANLEKNTRQAATYISLGKLQDRQTYAYNKIPENLYPITAKKRKTWVHYEISVP